jgi:paraquat-inducible protein A
MADLGARYKTGRQMRNPGSLVACGACGLIQVVDAIPSGKIAKCTRCRLVLQHRKPDSRARTLALALAALLLYFPANLVPILSAEYLGAQTRTKLVDGILALFQKGNYLVGGLVFTTSILAPGLKLVGLVLLCLSLRQARWLKVRSWVYNLVQICDPWSMLPVTLLALVIALVELGQVANVHPGPGLFAFAGMVALTSWASLTFDPEILWEEGEDTKTPAASSPEMPLNQVRW